MQQNMTENIFNNSDAYLRNLLHKFVLVCEEVQFVGKKKKMGRGIIFSWGEVQNIYN